MEYHFDELALLLPRLRTANRAISAQPRATRQHRLARLLEHPNIWFVGDDPLYVIQCKVSLASQNSALSPEHITPFATPYPKMDDEEITTHTLLRANTQDSCSCTHMLSHSPASTNITSLLSAAQ